MLLALVLLVACEQPPPPEAPLPGAMELGDEVIVTVDGHAVTQKLLDVGTRPMAASQREALLGDPAKKRELVERMAFAELLYNKAIEADLHEQPETQEAIALAQREILANLMLERIGDEAVTEEAVQQRYTAMAVQLNRPSAQVHHILVPKQDQANQLVEQLKAGEIDFLDAARKFSTDRGIQQHGGDLGWTTRAPILELQEAWETAPVGEIVGPVEGRLGFHILRVMGRRDKTPLEDVRPQLEEMLKIEAMKAARAELMGKAEVVWADQGQATPPATPPADAGADQGGQH